MAAPPIAAHPGRTLVAFLVALVALGGLMFAVDRSPTPRLGLDLKGGTSITLTAATTEGSDVTPESLQTAADIISSRVNGSGVVEADITTQGSNTIVVAVPDVGEDELVELVGTTAELRFRQVCNIAAGTPAPVPTVTPTPTGSVTPSADPSDSTTPAALGRFGSSAGSLRGAALAAAATTIPATTTPAATPSTTDSATAEPPAELAGCLGTTADPELQQAFTDLDCSDPANLQGGRDDPAQPIVSCEDEGVWKYVLAPATVLGTDVEDATAGLPQNGIGNWQVNLQFTGDGAKKFTAMSELLVSSPPPTNQFGIVLDSIVQSAPVMQSRIPGSTAQITGDFTQAEAQQLANVLKYGALPLAFTISDVSEVTPTLGSASLRAGLVAGLIGLGLVLVYALFYYRALGVVVVASLAIAAALTYITVVLMSEWIGFTLTLAGVAGLIVAIGITADSFIIYFERIRDEIREGRTLRAAVEHGWGRARRTIISADFISLLSAVVLYIVSIGNVRGFAFALGLTTVIDLVIVFLFTKPLMSWLVSTRLFAEDSRWSRVAGERLGRPVASRTTRPRRAPGGTIAEET